MPQTAIYVEIDDVPVTGIPASERVSLTASATVDGDSAGNTLVSFGNHAPHSHISRRFQYIIVRHKLKAKILCPLSGYLKNISFARASGILVFELGRDR